MRLIHPPVSRPGDVRNVSGWGIHLHRVEPDILRGTVRSDLIDDLFSPQILHGISRMEMHIVPEIVQSRSFPRCIDDNIHDEPFPESQSDLIPY